MRLNEEISRSVIEIDYKISRLRSENSQRLKRLEKVSCKIDELIAIRNTLCVLNGHTSEDSNCYHDMMEKLIKSNYV